MRKLIHTNWEIDLSNLKISDREENSAFSDSFSSKITYPFEIDLDNDLDKYFGFISLYETNPETIYDCYYFHNDKYELAKLEILEVKGRKLSLSYEFGLEQFPNWDKKLSELSLEEFDLPEGVSIYEHAETIINQTYPAVNYNFPQIHTDKYSIDDAEWENFKQIINNRNAGVFLENVFSPLNGYQALIKNIVQPFVNPIYLLKKIAEDANFMLNGEILFDSNLIKRLVFTTKNNLLISPEYEFNMGHLYKNHTSFLHPDFFYYKYYNIIKPEPIENGVFRVTGFVRMWKTTDAQNSYFNIFLNGNLIFQTIDGDSGNYEDRDIDFTFIANSLDNEIRIEHFVTSIQGSNSSYPLWDDELICDLDFFRVGCIDNDGVPYPNLYNEPKINLKKSVPEMTCGEYITQLKNWFNYGFDVFPGKVLMNKISNSIDRTQAISLQEFEAKEPSVKYQSGMSFLHQFADIDSKDYVYKKVFQDRNGFRTENYTVNSKTNVIEVNALPLPNTSREGVNTAHAVEGNETKLYLVEYDGLVNGQNLSKNNTSIFLENCHNEYFFEWLKFRIFAKMFVWDFYSNKANINSMNVKNVIYCYNNYHIIKTLQKTEESPEVFKIEIETETISS